MKIVNCKYIFTEDEQQQIIAWYLEPQSLKWIAAQFGIKQRNVIKRVLIDNDIKLRTKAEIDNLNAINVKKTFNAKYGVDSIFQLPEIKEKIKQTCLDKYGVENPQQAEEIKEKTRTTCLERYGITNGGWSSAAQEKIKQTNLEKFGVEWSQQSAEVRQKGKQTCLEKYGTEYANQSKEIKNKIEQTMLEKYGVRRYAQTEEFHYKSQHKYKYNNETFDSFPELAYYIYHIDHNIVIKRVPTKIKYVYENIEHYYIPDFEVDGKLIEIKGDQFFKEDGTMQCPFDHNYDGLAEAKHQCMLKNRVNILRSADYQFAIDYFNSKYLKENFIVEKYYKGLK